MKSSSVKLTREQLYREVWKTPIHRLSEKYGLSDVGLAKACKRMKIPRPPRGYWRRKETGANVRKTALPPASEDTQLEIEFHPKDRPIRGWKRGERGWTGPAPLLGPPESLSESESHPLVLTTLQRFEKATEGKDGILRSRAKLCLDLHLSRDQLDRSLRLLDGVFRAWEEQGHRVEVRTSEEGSLTLLCAGEEEIGISIVEETKEFELEPTEEEQLQPKWTWKKRTETRPMGHLTVYLIGDRIAESRSFHRRYRDGQDAPVEEKGGRILKASLEYLEARQFYRAEEERKRVEWEEKQRQWELEWQQEEERRRREEEEERRVKAFLKASEKWESARRLREFIASCEEELDAAETNQQRGRDWIGWANQVADRIDPLRNGYLQEAVAERERAREPE